MKVLCALVALLLVTGCAPGSTSTTAEPGEEVTSQTSPAEEDTSSPSEEEGDGDSAQEVSVELPGLPIGGNEALFTAEQPEQCVDVNWTGPTLPDGVALEFRHFTAPPEFTVDSSSCSDTPCVGGGIRVTAETGGCTVSVIWKGERVPDPGSSVLRADKAKAFCSTETACEEVAAAAESGKAGAVIQLIVSAGEASTSDGSSPSVDTGSG